VLLSGESHRKRACVKLVGGGGASYYSFQCLSSVLYLVQAAEHTATNQI
jgi:hypothetical protein